MSQSRGYRGLPGEQHDGKIGRIGAKGKSMSLLQVHEIQTFYGKIQALKGISLTVEQGEIVTLIGGNGAGKTTTLNTISGITPAAEVAYRLRRQGHHEGARPSDRQLRHYPVAGGTEDLHTADRAREPGDGGVCAE